MLFSWLTGNYQWLLGLLLQGFIAYHVFFLTKRLSVRDKLLHKQGIKRTLDLHLADITGQGLNRKMVLSNSKLSEEKETEKSRAYAEIKSTRSDGVEFFGGIGTDKRGKKIYTVYLLPYENIEYVDLRGDFEGNGYPQIFCAFKGLQGTPWTEVRSYQESSVYHEGNDPPDYRYSRITN